MKIKSLKLKIDSKKSVADERTATLSKKGNEIYKVIYESYPKDIEHFGVFTLVVYYHNSVPIYIDYENVLLEQIRETVAK